jgi:hypothetical protein
MAKDEFQSDSHARAHGGTKMSSELVYKCDVCGKVLQSSPGRTGTVYGDITKLLLDSGDSSWHACSDICLVRLFEGWIVRVKARVAKKLEEDKASKFRVSD